MSILLGGGTNLFLHLTVILRFDWLMLKLIGESLSRFRKKICFTSPPEFRSIVKLPRHNKLYI